MCSGGDINQNLSNAIASLYKHLLMGKYQRNYHSGFSLSEFCTLTYIEHTFYFWFDLVLFSLTQSLVVLPVAHDVPDSLDI